MHSTASCTQRNPRIPREFPAGLQVSFGDRLRLCARGGWFCSDVRATVSLSLSLSLSMCACVVCRPAASTPTRKRSLSHSLSLVRSLLPETGSLSPHTCLAVARLFHRFLHKITAPTWRDFSHTLHDDDDDVFFLCRTRALLHRRESTHVSVFRTVFSDQHVQHDLSCRTARFLFTRRVTDFAPRNPAVPGEYSINSKISAPRRTFLFFDFFFAEQK